MVQHPKLSVTLANYNHGHYLRQSIESVLCQTFRDFELIIVDDGSTDNSWEIIQEYAHKDHRIVAERAPKNRGALATSRRTYDLCRGELFFGRAADDYLIDPDFFRYAIEGLQQFPDAAGTFAGSEVIHADTGVRYATMGYRKSAEEAQRLFSFIPKERAQTEFLLGQLFIPGASAIWKKQLLDTAGGFDDSLGPQSDYFLNHALPMQQGVIEIHKLSATVRGMSGSYSSNVEEEIFFARHARVERKIRGLIKEARDENAWLHWRNFIIGMRFTELENTQTSLLARTKEIQGQICSFPKKSRRQLAPRIENFRYEAVLEFERLARSKEQRLRQAQALFKKIVCSKKLPKK